MQPSLPITELLTEKAVQENIVTGIQVTDARIVVNLEPRIAVRYVRPDCQELVAAHRYDHETITVQGLGIQGKALRYVVKTVRLAYLNDAGKLVTFNAPLPGIRTDLLVTDEVVDKALYLIVDRNISLPIAAEMLHDLYQVETSSSALDRWKAAEAEALPSIGQLIQRLNEKLPITVLHLDEYKATGTKSWELVLRDEHGRLLFSICLKKRDEWHIKVILRWLRLLGLQIKVFYVDFWLAYPVAIRAIYPQAEIQFDFFHVIQNIHRHLYKAFTAYRKAYRSAGTTQEQAKVRAALHKQLWENRYLLFTNEENLSAEQQQVLDELLREHCDTIVEQIVVFRWYLRDIFNASTSFAEAVEKLAFLILEGWADVSSVFGKVMAFLQEHFANMLTYLRVPGIQRNSLSECTVRSLRRIERIRQGFKTQQGRVNHLKLLQWRKYLQPAS
jgi:hypothetical protein